MTDAGYVYGPGRSFGARTTLAALLAAFLQAPLAAQADLPAETPPPTTAQDAASAATAAAAAPGESAQDELSRRATDPTASPPSVALINDFTFSYQDLPGGTPIDEDGYELRFQSVVPFVAWGAPNILRVTLPYQVSGPGAAGLGDVTLFDLVIVPLSRGRLGVGAVGSFAASTKETDAHAVGGPAIGIVLPMSKKVNIGLFNQNLFGDGVSISQLQPIFAYQLGSGWSLSLGDLQFPYDWDRGEFLSLPVGVQIGKVLPIAGQPMRFSINPQYDFKDLPGAGRFSAQLTVQLMLPEKKK